MRSRQIPEDIFLSAATPFSNAKKTVIASRLITLPASDRSAAIIYRDGSLAWIEIKFTGMSDQLDLAEAAPLGAQVEIRTGVRIIGYFSRSAVRPIKQSTRQITLAILHAFNYNGITDNRTPVNAKLIRCFRRFAPDPIVVIVKAVCPV